MLLQLDYQVSDKWKWMYAHVPLLQFLARAYTFLKVIIRICSLLLISSFAADLLLPTTPPRLILVGLYGFWAMSVSVLQSGLP